MEAGDRFQVRPRSQIIHGVVSGIHVKEGMAFL